jgi:outer membrane protein assembly factor BamB/protein-L-isoaspartate O-methyltransferase
MKCECRLYLIVFLLAAQSSAAMHADDWSMLGRDRTRNSVSTERHPPVDWSLGKFDRETGTWDRTNARNIKWTRPLGPNAFGTPVIADGQVYIGTGNAGGYVKRYPRSVDLGCLLCFRESDGEFLWQFSAEKHPGGRNIDWPTMGLGASPLVEGGRMWFVSNRYELLCLDTQGFRDGENDGPYVDEAVTADNEADIIWRYDMMAELGVFPHCASMGPQKRCSPAPSYRNRIYIVTGNGPDEGHVEIPAPHAPSLVCFDKDSGKVLWQDASPGGNILHSQVADPLVIEIGGRGQVIVPQGDGWIRSFDAMTGELIWKFDINHKESMFSPGGRGTRNNILATPVLYKGRIYIGSGQEMEHGEGKGRLVCIDSTKTGDISAELAVDDHGRPIPHGRWQTVNPVNGELAIPNPNSGLIWEYSEVDHDGNGEIDFEEEFHRTVGSVVIRNDVLIAVDVTGLIQCFHAQTGERHWVYDAFASIWAPPLIVDDYAYVVDDESMVSIFRLSADPDKAMRVLDGERHPVAVMEMDASLNSQPVFSNGVLYVASRQNLFAIANPDARNASADSSTLNLKHSGEKAVHRKSQKPAGSAIRAPRPVFVPTPQDVVEAMLEAAGVTEQDAVIDLGSGDGRIVITAARKYGARGIGYEIDRALVHQSRKVAEHAGVTKRADFREQDMYTARLSEARVVTAFLYPAVLQKLRTQFAEMKPGSLVVCHHFRIPGAKVRRVITVSSKETGNDHRVFLYQIPLVEDLKSE